MFRIISDLHLEGMSRYDLPKTENERDTVLILAGDICEFPLIDKHEGYQNFLEDCNNRFKTTVYIPGNHEYYGASINDFGKYKKLIEQRYENIRVLDRETIKVPMNVQGKEMDFKIVCATLWTDMNRKDPITMVTGLNYLRLDFTRIEDFTPEIFVAENEKARAFIRSELNNSKENYDPTIVLTHHGPTAKSISPKYQNLGQNTNALFINSDLEELFDELPLRLWIHGHTHDGVDHLLGHGCRVIANPKGLTTFKLSGKEVFMYHQNSRYDELLTLTPEALYF